MKGGDHRSPFATLSFPDPKKVHSPVLMGSQREFPVGGRIVKSERDLMNFRRLSAL